MKFNLFILIGIVFSLFVLPVVFASDAKISYAVVNTPVVYDIPFSVNVLTATSDAGKPVPIIEYGVTVTSDTNRALFQSYSSDPAALNVKTGPLDTNTKYRVFTDSSGNSWTPATLFTLGVKFTGKPADEKGTKIILDSKPAVGHFFTPATGKGSPFTSITSTDSGVIIPQLSKCGDGVVGYVDTNVDGINNDGDKGAKTQEACDSSDGANKDKCVNCQYVAIGYVAQNCGFGSYGCTIKKMNSKELFLARVTALVNGNCYPDANHPAAEFCDTVAKKPLQYYTDNKLEGEKKLEFIVQFGRILKEFFTGLPN